MTTFKEKAEQYVREQLPELKETYKDALYVYVRNGAGKDSYSDVCDYIDEYPQWIPLELQHWLRVSHSYRLLTEGEEYFSGNYVPAGQLLMWHEKAGCIFFNLTTGQPATPEDYQAFCNIVGV